MIDALIAGKLHGQPAQRTSKAGKPFAIAKVRVATGENESIFVSVIAFDHDPVTGLLALGNGDSVSLAGTLKPGIWTDRDGNTKPSLDLTAHAVLTSYHVQRKRKAVAGGGQGDRSSRPPVSEPDGYQGDDLNF